MSERPSALLCYVALIVAVYLFLTHEPALLRGVSEFYNMTRDVMTRARD